MGGNDVSGKARVEVVVPFVPGEALAPNKRLRRGGFWDGEDAKGQMKMAAKGAGINARQAFTAMGGGPIVRGPVTVSYLVRWPKGRRRPDCDALPAMLKPCLDGLVTAHIIDGDGCNVVVRVCAEQEKYGGPGEVVVTIEEATA